MNRFVWLVSAIACCWSASLYSQSLGPGIGIYPTGTETGLGFRSAKDKRLALDARIAKLNYINNPDGGAMANELSLIYRIAYYERVRFHIGIGARADWNFGNPKEHRFGPVVPIGVEAFPFPFQTAGLFFEVAPFYTASESNRQQIGMRAAGGFVFYFLRNNKTGSTPQ